MLRIAPLSSKQAVILAVGALDNLVTELVRASPTRMTPEFFDWVADEATPLVEMQLSASFRTQGFAAALHRGDPRIALARCVREWVGPRMTRRFAALASHLPAHSSPPERTRVA